MQNLPRFAWSDAALKQLGDLPLKIRKQVVQKARTLLENPHPPGSRKLHNIEGSLGEPIYRIRSGDYRILYMEKSVPAYTLVILDVGNRKDVYR